MARLAVLAAVLVALVPAAAQAASADTPTTDVGSPSNTTPLTGVQASWSGRHWSGSGSSGRFWSDMDG